MRVQFASESEMATWRRAAPPTVTLSEAVDGLRVAHRLNKYEPFWRNAVCTALMADSDAHVRREVLSALPVEAANAVAWRSPELAELWFKEELARARQYYMGAGHGDAPPVHASFNTKPFYSRTPPEDIGLSFPSRSGSATRERLVLATELRMYDLGWVGEEDKGNDTILSLDHPLVGGAFKAWLLAELAAHLERSAEKGDAWLGHGTRTEAIESARTLVKMEHARAAVVLDVKGAWDRARFASSAIVFARVYDALGRSPARLATWPSFEGVCAAVRRAESLYTVSWSEGRDVATVLNALVERLRLPGSTRQDALHIIDAAGDILSDDLDHSDARERFLGVLHIWQLDLWVTVRSLFFPEPETKTECLWLRDAGVAGLRE